MSALQDYPLAGIPLFAVIGVPRIRRGVQAFLAQGRIGGMPGR